MCIICRSSTSIVAVRGLRAAREGGEVVVRVRDDGLGIPEDLLLRIFDLLHPHERDVLDVADHGDALGRSAAAAITSSLW